MNDLDDLIRYENEGTRLDFKAVQYAKGSFEAFLKDLMAMANANVSGDRYIVMGVKHRPDGTRDFLGINRTDFADPAIYHQVVRDNIEPEILFDYTPHTVDGTLIGILRIHGCDNPPYIMRKQYGQGLREGDAYIRKGSHQTRVTRRDLDLMFARRSEAEGHAVALRVGFDAPDLPNEITLPAASDTPLPSEQAAMQIRAILEERERAANDPLTAGFIHLAIGAGAYNDVFGETSYARMSNDRLTQALEHVAETYREHDLHARHERRAVKLNIRLVNDGTSYIEDASIRLRIPKLDGLVIADRVYNAPFNPLIPASLAYLTRDRSEYPLVTEQKDFTEVIQDIGDLRHGFPDLAFEEPLRVTIGSSLVGKKIVLDCAIFGKQLRVPHTSELSILVTEPSP